MIMKIILTILIITYSALAGAQGTIQPGAIDLMSKEQYPKAYAKWGSGGFKKINQLMKPAAEIILKSNDCKALETIALSDERSDPKKKKIVFFADCKDQQKNYVRYYITEDEILSKITPASDKAAASLVSKDEMARQCYLSTKSRMAHPSTFKPTFGGTITSTSPIKPGASDVNIDFTAKNGLGAILPYRSTCYFQGGKLTETSINPR